MSAPAPAPSAPSATSEWIELRGARQHNLSGVDCRIPLGKLTVVTGVSGCGKSSLAFHTLYAQAQRYFVESLSAQARQFFQQLPEPEVDAIEGLRPAIALQQQKSRASSRATVASMTEIEPFLRVLWATCGDAHDPATGHKLEVWSPAAILDKLLEDHDEARALILAPMRLDLGLSAEELLRELAAAGFVRLRLDGQLWELEQPDCAQALAKSKQAQLVIDRLVLRDRARERLADSLETAIQRAVVEVCVAVQQEAGEDWQELRFATVPTNPETGFRSETLTPAHFSAQSRRGACPQCQGLGQLLRAEAQLLVPDESLSLAQGALKTWWASKKRLKAPRLAKLRELLEALAEVLAQAPTASSWWEAPWRDLPSWLQAVILEGEAALSKANETKQANFPQPKEAEKLQRVLQKSRWEGLLAEAERIYGEAKSQLTRQLAKRNLAPQPCPSCQGKRLKAASLAVALRGSVDQQALSAQMATANFPSQPGFADFLSLNIAQAKQFLQNWTPQGRDQAYARPLLKELLARLGFLEQVGLGYLNLDRAANTLSGGEEQRLRLASSLGGPLSGVLYVLDEPSIGLHPADTQRLLDSLQALVKRGNTVVVVEHEPAFWRTADWLIELGPGPGDLGGKLIFQGTAEQLRDCELDLPSPTRLALEAEEQGGFQPLEEIHREPNKQPTLQILKPREHNLRFEKATIPLGCLVAVTGPSGSGKSSLVNGILHPALARSYHRSSQKVGAHEGLLGTEYLDRVVLVDQSSMGGSKRSNAVTYCKAFEPIRKLFSQLPLSRQRGYSPARFSFNRPGGRCEACEGMGTQLIDMQLLAPVEVVCESCQGQRYNRPTLEIRYKGLNLAEILELSIDQALQFFAQIPEIARRLQPLHEVGLGYLKLGQSSQSFSGGEAQRLRLAAELALPKQAKTLYLLDEPSTGLHPADIQVLLKALRALIEQGHSVLFIEHQVELIRAADWVIDLGPGGGNQGGELIFAGPPQELRNHEQSSLAAFL